MRKQNVVFLFVLFAIQTLIISGTSHAASPEEKRAKIRRNANAILQELYEIEPKAQRLVDNSAGYAVFSNFGMKIFVAGGGSGKGVAVNNRTGRETFMRMLEIQAGLGMGAKTFKLVWVFDTASKFNHFVNSGWEFGGQATAAAQIKDAGGAYEGALSVSDGVWLYQLTGSGLALELTAKGTKYFRDKKLNRGL